MSTNVTQFRIEYEAIKTVGYEGETMKNLYFGQSVFRSNNSKQTRLNIFRADEPINGLVRKIIGTLKLKYIK